MRELLRATDDMFVVSRPGDEIALSFDASALPPLPAGWTRTFLLYSDGYSKEMDLNSASPDQAWPLPFHRMTTYPYAAPEHFPLTDAHRAYIQRYNTGGLGLHYMLRRNVRLMGEGAWDFEREQARFTSGVSAAF